MDDFEYKLREIFFYIGSFGIRHKQINIFKPHLITEEDKIEFTTYVYKGFRIGQSLIVEEILNLYEDKKFIKKQFLEARKSKDKSLLNVLEGSRYEVDYRIKILRHFADFIAWQLFKGQYFMARRFHSGDKSRPDLLNTNFQSVINAANYFHKESPLNFALITDLTTFIDVGDILLASPNTLTIVECKSGEVQNKVHKLIDELKGDDWMKAIEKLVKENSKKGAKSILDQTQRTINQLHKGTKARDFIRNEAGTDTFSDKEVQIFESKIPEQNYYDKIIEAFNDAIIPGYSSGAIEDVIFFAVFRNNKVDMAFDIFNAMANELSGRTHRTNYLYQLELPIKQPLFFKPFGEEIIFELLTGRLKLFLVIDIDKLIELFNSTGIKARWMTRKETNKYLDDKPMYRPYMYENQAIQVEVADRKLVLGSQFLTKILLDNVTPSSFVDQYKSYLTKPITKKT